MEHKGTKTLETDRLLIRKFTESDIEFAFRNWTNDEQVTKYLRWPTHKELSITERVVGTWIKEYDNLNYYQWAIVPKSLNEPIGTISIVGMDEKTEKVVIGYCIGSKWWNTGYISEAFQAVIDFLFEEVKVNRIEATHDPKNVGSGKVMIKCGLTYEGTLRKYDWSNQGIVDSSFYSILAEDYYK